MSGGDTHRGKSLKLLEKIPEDAEATVVLVGKEGRELGLRAASSVLTPAPTCPSQPASSPALSSPVLCLLPFQFSAVVDDRSSVSPLCET